LRCCGTSTDRQEHELIVGAHQHSCYHATQGCLYRRDFDAPCETRWLRAQKRRTPWPENRAPTRFPFPWMALSDLRVFVFAERAAAADGAGGSSAAAPGVSGPMKSAAEVEESPPYMSTSSSQFMASLPADIAAPCPARRCTEGDPLVVLLGYKPQPAQAQTHPQRHKQSVSVSRLGAGNKHTRVMGPARPGLAHTCLPPPRLGRFSWELWPLVRSVV